MCFDFGRVLLLYLGFVFNVLFFFLIWKGRGEKRKMGEMFLLECRLGGIGYRLVLLGDL